MPFLHPQPKEWPCRGDRDPLNTAPVSATQSKIQRVFFAVKDFLGLEESILYEE